MRNKKDNSHNKEDRKEEAIALKILKLYNYSYANYMKSEKPDFISLDKTKGVEIIIACDKTEKDLSHAIHTQIAPKPETKIFKNNQVKDYIEKRDANAFFVNGNIGGFSKPINLAKSTEIIWNAILKKLNKLNIYNEKLTFFELFIIDETDVIDINDFQTRLKEIFCRYKQKCVEFGVGRKYQTIFVYNKYHECLGVISVNKPTVSFTTIPCPSMSET